MIRIFVAACLSLLTIFAAATSAAAVSAAFSVEAGTPSGFDELTRDREMLVDVFFGGNKIGEARVIAAPGKLRFKEPDQVLKAIPNVDLSNELAAAFAADFPTNAGLVCPDDTSPGCGHLKVQVAGIIFDEDRFRVDLFINPKWLKLIRPEEKLYLPTPAAPLSLVTSSGLALSGATHSPAAYNFQNRTIVGFRNIRIRSDVSYASKIGLLTDTLVAEVDRPGIRYSAGLFWAPGLDLIGQRRIIGVGVGTQFDTRADHQTLRGTPLIVFLSQAARVDILIDGRLVTSAAYEAGNNVLDTSSLPDGSYSLLLRVHEANGSVREERRFFAKNPQIAPTGQPIYFGYAGLLANTKPGQPISWGKDLFYQFGSARRLSEKLAVDVSIIGTKQKPILEAGGWLITSLGSLRMAALASIKGDRGALLQISSAQTSPVALNFDLRRIWSHDGTPLIPLSTYVSSFNSGPIDGNQIGDGSYTQASASIGYRIGDAYLSVIGSFRKDKGSRGDYSVGPSLSWPIVNRHGLQIVLQADSQITRATRAGYLGFRMLYTRSGYSVSNELGGRSLSSRSGSAQSRSRMVGDTTAHYSYADEAGMNLSLAGGATRNLDSTTAHAGGILYSRFGAARAEILHNIEGGNRTQYGLTLQTGAIVNDHDALIGGRNLGESALVISVDGDSDKSAFDVLVNGQARGRVRAGGRLPLFLEFLPRVFSETSPGQRGFRLVRFRGT